MASIGLKLLGGFEVTLGNGTVARVPTRKAQATLAYLAMATGRRVPRDTLASLLWANADEPAARNNLRQTPARPHARRYRRLIEDRRATPREEAAAAFGSDPSMVGREGVLTRLEDALQAAALGSGRMVAILGEAGIGKSRLARELAAATERRDDRVITGACHVAEQTLPLHPWVEAVRRGGVLGSTCRRGRRGGRTRWCVPLLGRLLGEIERGHATVR